MNALRQYQAISQQTSITDADRHKLIQLLLDGILDRISTAKGQIQQKKFEAKNTLINKVLGIIGGLKSFLDMSNGEDLTQNLAALYEYMEVKLFEANLHNDVDKLDEVLMLVKTIKEGWDGIRQEALEKGLI